MHINVEALNVNNSVVVAHEREISREFTNSAAAESSGESDALQPRQRWRSRTTGAAAVVVAAAAAVVMKEVTCVPFINYC